MMKHKGIFGIFVACAWLNVAYAINTEDNNTLDKEKSSAKSYKLNKVIATVSTATGFEQELKNAPASMSIITNKDLQGRPIRDLGDAISQIPGVSIDAGATNTGGYSVSIRGMPSSYTLFLVDGTRQDVSSEAFPNFSFSQGSFMPPISAIDRIDPNLQRPLLCRIKRTRTK